MVQNNSVDSKTEANINWTGETEAKNIKEWVAKLPDDAMVGVRYQQGEVHGGVKNTIHASWDGLKLAGNGEDVVSDDEVKGPEGSPS